MPIYNRFDTQPPAQRRANKLADEQHCSFYVFRSRFGWFHVKGSHYGEMGWTLVYTAHPAGSEEYQAEALKLAAVARVRPEPEAKQEPILTPIPEEGYSDSPPPEIDGSRGKDSQQVTASEALSGLLDWNPPSGEEMQASLERFMRFTRDVKRIAAEAEYHIGLSARDWRNVMWSVNAWREVSKVVWKWNNR